MKQKINRYMRGDNKKYKIYKKDPKTGNIRKIEFGDPNMSIKRDNPNNRKNFRSRHNCQDKKDTMTAGYHSCKFWGKQSVKSLLKNENTKQIIYKRNSIMSRELDQYITESHFMMLTEAPKNNEKYRAGYDRIFNKDSKKSKSQRARDYITKKTKEIGSAAKSAGTTIKNKAGQAAKAGKGAVKSVGRSVGRLGRKAVKYGSNQAQGTGLSAKQKAANFGKRAVGAVGQGMRRVGAAISKHPGKAAAVAGVGLAGAGATYYWRRLRNGKRVKVKKGS